jgi:hypothetical protein
MVLAISAAEPLNVPGGGCVESVVTRRTHLRLCLPRFVEVEGIDLVQAANVAVQANGRNVSCKLEYSTASATPERRHGELQLEVRRRIVPLDA